MWVYFGLAIIAGLIIGIAATNIITSKKLREHEIINEEIREKNDKAQKKLDELSKAINSAEVDLKTTQEKDEYLKATLADLSAKITASQKEADNAVSTYYDKTLQAAKQNIQLDIESLEQQYAQAEQEYQNEYLKTLEENSSAYIEKIEGQKQTVQALSQKIEDLQEKVNAAVDANKRAAQLEQQKDFYKLILSDIDVEEIKRLRAVAPYLRDSEPLNKVIWKVYYENPYTDLIGRVIGNGVHCGIYKITNIDNGMCYVGQAVNIADRWKQHIKRGLGAETPTRNKLYPAMLASGVENFTFEVVEECNREKLNDREDYWQDYFKAKEYGYSIK